MIPGDIVLIEFPYSDLSQTKLRPALVIAQPDINEDLLICAISSKKKDSTIEINTKDLLTGLLPVTSYVYYQKLATISKSTIIKQVAALDKDKFLTIKEKLNAFLSK